MIGGERRGSGISEVSRRYGGKRGIVVRMYMRLIPKGSLSLTLKRECVSRATLRRYRLEKTNLATLCLCRARKEFRAKGLLEGRV